MLPQFSRTRPKIVATGIAACLALIAGCSSESDVTLPSSTNNVSAGSQTTVHGAASTGASIATSPSATASTKTSTTSAAPPLQSKPATSPVTSPAAGPVPTWTPPSRSPAQLAIDLALRKDGYKVEYIDPAIFPEPLKDVPKPIMPSEINSRTEQAAKRTILYFVNSLHHLLKTQDEAPLAAVASTTCDTCNSYINVTEITKREKGYTAPQEMHVSELRASNKGDN